ncbi:MAG: hypothetical protein EBU04_10605, partial [Verrucomicrobia bacterium]|nr:hypothetical protein [Verrucomicrobiota bacterium]
LAQKVAARRGHYQAYKEAFKNISGIIMQPEAPWGESTHWLTCLTLDPQRTNITAEQLRLALEAENIEARPIWKPLHLQPVFEGAEYHGRGVSDRLFSTGLCLPSGSAMTLPERDRVIKVIRSKFA